MRGRRLGREINNFATLIPKIMELLSAALLEVSVTLFNS